MSLELTLLAWSTVLLGLYLVTQAVFFRLEHGMSFAAGGRDDEPPAQSRYLQRASKALRNFLETYGVFIALVVVAELGQRRDGLTQWGAGVWFGARLAYLPLYVFGVPYLRSLVWTVAAAGLALMFFGVVWY